MMKNNLFELINSLSLNFIAKIPYSHPHTSLSVQKCSVLDVFVFDLFLSMFPRRCLLTTDFEKWHGSREEEDEAITMMTKKRIKRKN